MTTIIISVNKGNEKEFSSHFATYCEMSKGIKYGYANNLRTIVVKVKDELSVQKAVIDVAYLSAQNAGCEIKVDIFTNF